jgi:type I restriction enzyme, S subunit
MLTANNTDKSNWQTVRFGDVVREVNETEQDPLTKGITRYVGLADLDPDSIQLKRWSEISDGETTFTRLFRKGQMLFGRRRAYQRKAAVAPFDGICSGDIIVMEAQPDKLLPELLPFLIHTDGFFDYAIQTSAGSLSPRTKWSHLAKYEFALPPLAEQRRIAEVLTAVEEVIGRYQFFSELLLETRNRVFENMIELVEPEKKFTAKLREAIHDIFAGKSPRSGSESARLGEYGVLKVSAIGKYAYSEEENKAIKQSDFVPECEVRPGFLLVTRANAHKSGVARACIVESTRPGLMLSDKTVRLIVNEKRASNRYLLEALRGSMFREYVEVVATGTEAKNISQAKLKNSPIPLPPLSVQLEIENFLEQYDNAVRESQNHIEKLTHLKKSLLSSVV